MTPAQFKELRQRSGISQRAIASLAQCSNFTVSVYESGARTVSARNIERVCSALRFLIAQSRVYELECERRAALLGSSSGRQNPP